MYLKTHTSRFTKLLYLRRLVVLGRTVLGVHRSGQAGTCSIVS